jgi:hypothetical protein
LDKSKLEKNYEVKHFHHNSEINRRRITMKNINKITVSITALMIVAFSISSIAGTGHELMFDECDKKTPSCEGYRAYQ